jgi:hypothetical protein
MALGVNGSGVGIQFENPSKALQGGLITHTAAAAALQTYTPAPAGLFDSALVTNMSSSTAVRIVITAVGTTGTKTYLVLPTQAVSVGFDGLDQISAISSVPVTLPIVQGAVEVSTLTANAAPGEIVQVSIVLSEK